MLPGEEDYNYDDEDYEDEDFVNDVPQTTYQTRSGNTGTYNTGSYNMDSSYPSYGNTAVQNAQTSSFETKKSSISQNFERKAVNPNSAFQKAKTMQFQAQKNVPIPEQPYESVASQQPETNGYVGKYGADAPVAEPVQEAPQQEQTYHGAHEAPSGSSSTGSKTFLSSTGTFKRPNVEVLRVANGSLPKISSTFGRLNVPVELRNVLEPVDELPDGASCAPW